ncbi:hypothetical protein JAAARDRAFT_81881, partial [Jaapia argillacea MUCL 33604]
MEVSSIQAPHYSPTTPSPPSSLLGHTCNSIISFFTLTTLYTISFMISSSAAIQTSRYASALLVKCQDSFSETEYLVARLVVLPIGVWLSWAILFATGVGVLNQKFLGSSRVWPLKFAGTEARRSIEQDLDSWRTSSSIPAPKVNVLPAAAWLNFMLWILLQIFQGVMSLLGSCFPPLEHPPSLSVLQETRAIRPPAPRHGVFMVAFAASRFMGRLRLLKFSRRHLLTVDLESSKSKPRRMPADWIGPLVCVATTDPRCYCTACRKVSSRKEGGSPPVRPPPSPIRPSFSVVEPVRSRRPSFDNRARTPLLPFRDALETLHEPSTKDASPHAENVASSSPLGNHGLAEALAKMREAVVTSRGKGKPPTSDILDVPPKITPESCGPLRPSLLLPGFSTPARSVSGTSLGSLTFGSSPSSTSSTDLPVTPNDNAPLRPFLSVFNTPLNIPTKLPVGFVPLTPYGASNPLGSPIVLLDKRSRQEVRDVPEFYEECPINDGQRYQ